MAKNAFLDWDTTANNNTDIGSINIAEGCPPSNINNAIREVMAQLRAGVDGEVVYAAKAGSYVALATDNNAVHRYTATATVSLTAATLGANWHYTIIADGADVTIDPNGAETIDGAATLVVPNGYSAFIVCNGSAFFTNKISTTVKTLLSSKAALTDVADYIVDIVPSFVSTTSISVSTGSAFCGGKSFSISSTLTKVFTSTFVAGNGGGILDTGAIAASKTYHLYAIRRISDGAGDIVASLSATAAGVTMTNLSGWEVLSGSRVGSVLTNVSSQIIAFRQYGNQVLLETPIQEFSVSSNIDTPAYNSANVPESISVDGRWTFNIAAGSNSSAILRAATEKTSGLSHDASLLVNCVSNTQITIGVKARTTSAGLVWVNFAITVGSATGTMTAVGWEDYTCRRLTA